MKIPSVIVGGSAAAAGHAGTSAAVVGHAAGGGASMVGAGAGVLSAIDPSGGKDYFATF